MVRAGANHGPGLVYHYLNRKLQNTKQMTKQVHFIKPRMNIESDFAY
jgi:hypothetical protein